MVTGSTFTGVPPTLEDAGDGVVTPWRRPVEPAANKLAAPGSRGMVPTAGTA